jgi:arabinofuranan 3-O-arabinosyltransferase
VRQATIVTLTGQLETLPVRLSRLSVPALAGLRAVTPDEQARFTLACGRGPALTVDGQVYQTSVRGTIGELSQYLPLQVGLCSPGGALSLGAGQHTLIAATPGTFAVTDLSLASSDAGAETAATSGGSRAVVVRSWQPDQGRVSVGPGAASYLEVHENYNAGWAAALNGQQLTPVRLDGWQQGFVVPAGAGGTITLSFRPAGAYLIALAVSVLAAVLLLALTAWSFIGRRRESGRDTGSGPAVPHAWSPPLPATAAGASPVGNGRAWLGVLAVTALIFVVGGPVALAVPVLACLAWLVWLPRSPGRAAGRDWLPVLAVAGMIASGLLSAAKPFGTGLLGPFGWPAQAGALVALAAALTPEVAVSVRRRLAARETPAAPAATAGEGDR